MADSLSPAKRSWLMSRVGSKHTLPEMTVRRALHAAGFRYRLHVKELPGTPDIVLPGLQVVIFVHGCFWHGHPECRYASLPKTRTEWWSEKIARNILHDGRAALELSRRGWEAMTVWGCELRAKKRDATLERLIEELKLRKRGSLRR